MKFGTEKIKIATHLLNTEDKAIINDIKALLKSYENDSWDEMPAIVQESVEQGIEDANKGIGKPHNQVMKEIKEWVSTIKV